MHEMVSIISPSYNQGRFLQYCLGSVADQGPNATIEHLVYDGGSNDNSVDILNTAEPPPNFWQSAPDGGQSAAINSGMSRAKGRILCWINSDDGLAPGACARMTAALDSKIAPAWAIGGCRIIDEENQEVALWYPQNGVHDELEAVLNWPANYLIQPAVFWTRSMWDVAGGVNEKLNLAMDFDLWLRFFQVAKPIILPELIGVHRVHGETKTSNCGNEIFDEYLSSISSRLGGKRQQRFAARHVARAISLRANRAASLLQDDEALQLLMFARKTHPCARFEVPYLKALSKLTFRYCKRGFK